MFACYLIDGLQGCEIEVVVQNSNSQWLQASWSCSRQLVDSCALFGTLRVDIDDDGYLYCVGLKMMFSHYKIVWKYNFGKYCSSYLHVAARTL